MADFHSNASGNVKPKFDELWRDEMKEWAKILGELNEWSFRRVVSFMHVYNADILREIATHSLKVKKRLLVVEL